jgi:glyoxylase-like metal-dependent hydrolase (beta-lactamase superfamily II)
MTRPVFLSYVISLVFHQACAQTTPVYEIYALKFSARGSVALSEMVSGGPTKDSVSIFYMFWLIKASDGKNILVDAGFDRGLEWAGSLPFYKRPDSILLELNIKADEISDIILTHPHADHMDGISLFPKAHIWIQKEDYNYFVGEAWQKQGRHGGLEKRDVDLLVDRNVAGQLTLVDGDDKELFPGIRVFTGSKHTTNSQYVLVQTGGEKVIIASDNIWIYYNLDHLITTPYMYGTIDTVAYVQSMKRMKTQVSDIKYIIPGHDASLFSRFPAVKPDVIRIK